MGIGTLDSRRPPLPAPTESMGDENSAPETEVDTNLTYRTDKTSYSIPEDGRPITISTQKITGGKTGGSGGGHSRDKSQTSLLIEYFEASKTGDKTRNRPSVRVKVTPSSNKKSRSGHDAIQITGIGSDRKPSYTRRISLGNSSKNVEVGRETTEFSHSSGSNASAKDAVEIEVLNDGSDVSNNRSSRGLMYAPFESNVSSMPPDSMLEGTLPGESELSREVDYDDSTPTKDTPYLKAPAGDVNRDRSASQERIAQKVMEKLGASSKQRKSSRSSREHSQDYEYESRSGERRKVSSQSRRGDRDTISGAESSLLSSNVSPSHRSYRSSSSQASRMTNNPKLLEMVEDTIKRMILPEINAIREDQKTDRKLRKFSESGRDSAPLERESIERRVSKSSSSPNISSKPKVVLNRDGENPGTVLSRGDSERVKARKSSREYSERSASRRSSGRHSRESSHDDVEERLRSKSSRGNNTLRGAASAGLGGALTAAALKHHDSQDDIHHRRKKRSKSRNSRSRSASINETINESYRKGDIPPMPLVGNVNDSELTRDSILSQGTEQPDVHGSGTPLREVSRGSIGDANSPASSRTPSRNPLGNSIGMSFSNNAIESPKSPRSPHGGLSNRERLAALTAAGLGGAVAARSLGEHNVDADGYGTATATQRKVSSPVQSVSSLRKNFEDDSPAPQGLRPQSAASRSSAGRLRSSRNSQTSLRSLESPPTTTKLASSRKHSREISAEKLNAQIEGQEASYSRSRGSTPNGETTEEWFERQHALNDRYRDSLGGTTNRDSYQTNPYPQDEHRFTMHTDDSLQEDDPAASRDVQDVGLNPGYIHTPLAVESAVASLMEPSTVGSHVVSSVGSPAKNRGSYSDRMAEQFRFMDEDDPAMYEGSTLSQTMTSQDRWAALRGYAKNISGSLENLDTQSPRQSPVRSTRDVGSFDGKPVMVASGLPLADDPLPEIGHFDDSKSDVTTNPSIIQGPLGGDITGKSTWPYTPEPQHEAGARESRSTGNGHNNDAGILAAAAGGAAVLAAASTARQPTVEDEKSARDVDFDRDGTPTGSPAPFRDEGYVTDGRARSNGGITPQFEQQRYGKKDLEEYERAMDAQDDDDIFGIDSKHARHMSGNSHGMSSPLYDSSTGKGMDRIQSKDIVALMDHLTVRDAQRNARDTEILTSLVRSAAEMRQSFDEMKKFIVEQDKMIMQNTDRGAEHTAHKVLSGPRPQPLGSPRTPRRPTESEEDIQTKRKGVLRRAIKGFTRGKSGKDLAKIEDMLMQILDNVEDLKHQKGDARPLDRAYTSDTLDSYEKLRNVPDSGYEPEGRAGTSSTPSESGHLNVAPKEKQQFHSGYDGRRGSYNRVSTVLEDDEDDLEPHENAVLSHQFENNERMMTPTQEQYRTRAAFSPNDNSPSQINAYNNSSDKQRKHKSNSSSLFGVPKVSRWSRTTASSAAPDPATLDSPNQARNVRPLSEASRSQSTLDRYDDDDFDTHKEERQRNAQTFSKEQERAGAAGETRSMRSQASRVTRTPSPLVPSEASARDRDGYGDAVDHVPSPLQEDDEAYLDDPKYHAHRNSILLQHPQPRQGPTPRHQNTLESQAHAFDDVTGTNSDLSQRTVSDFDPAIWGSSATAGLARHRLTQIEPLSPVSMSSPAGYGGKRDDGPLVPQAKPTAAPKIRYEPEPEPEIEPEWEPQFSNSGFSKGGYYSSPYGSGHLLEPIEEVRYSLETDRNLSPEPQVASAQAVDMRTSARKITGPRPMGTRSPGQSAQPRLVDNTGTVRRKPVPRSPGSQDSFSSETF